jgi:hypothetical protein
MLALYWRGGKGGGVGGRKEVMTQTQLLHRPSIKHLESGERREKEAEKENFQNLCVLSFSFLQLLTRLSCHSDNQHEKLFAGVSAITRRMAK